MNLKGHEDYVSSIFGYTKKKTQSQTARATRLEHRRARIQAAQEFKKQCSKEAAQSSHEESSQQQFGLEEVELSHEEGSQQQVDLEEVELGHEAGSQQQVDLEEIELSHEEGSQHQFGVEETVESSEGNSSQPHAVCYVPAVCHISVPISSHHRTDFDIIRNNDSATHFYTGLPTWGLFEFLLSHLTVHYNPFNIAHLKITPANGLLMVLMRLRLNALLEDLSYRFGIGVTTVSTVIQT